MSSYSNSTQNCNYYCPVCKKSGKLPNIAGRFFLINDTQCKCNGCNTVFDKSEYYARPVHENNIDGPWTFPSSDIGDNKLGTIHEIKSPSDNLNNNFEDLETVPIVNTGVSYPTTKIYKYFKFFRTSFSRVFSIFYRFASGDLRSCCR